MSGAAGKQATRIINDRGKMMRYLGYLTEDGENVFEINNKEGNVSGKSRVRRNTIVAQVGELLSADLDEETVLMSLANGNYYGMDAIGSHIWALIKKPLSMTELCDILVGEFEVERDRCEQDVLAFLNELAQENLVEVFGATTG